MKSTYIEKLVQTCVLDIMRWDTDFFDTHIAKNGFGNNNLKHTFTFLAFQSKKSARDELYSKTEVFPLLRYRVFTLSDQLHNSSGIKSVLKNHVQRINWHLHRIYRARNYIVHDALIGHKLAVQIMDEILENKDNEDITAENALKYLYYDSVQLKVLK